MTIRKRQDDAQAPTVASEVEWVEIDSLRPWEDNPRINDHAVPSVAESIKRFGWGSPVLARREDGAVIAGHTRLKAARLLGMRQALVRWMDVSEAEARALALADNKLSEISDWDEEKLASVLSGLSELEVNLDGLGWSEAEMSALLGGTDSEAAPDVAVTQPASHKPVFAVIAELATEQEQQVLYQELASRGYSLRLAVA